MPKLTKGLEVLNDKDIYSTILLALYEMRDDPNYLTLSELAFVIDKDNLIKMCELFGGLTITIPTISELETALYGLILYQRIDIEGKSMEEALATIDRDAPYLFKVREAYAVMHERLGKYNLERSTNEPK